MIISQTGVPDEHLSLDEWGAETILRLDDGWCSALDLGASMFRFMKIGLSFVDNSKWAHMNAGMKGP
jgi:hypothetical protein